MESDYPNFNNKEVKFYIIMTITIFVIAILSVLHIL